MYNNTLPPTKTHWGSRKLQNTARRWVGDTKFPVEPYLTSSSCQCEFSPPYWSSCTHCGCTWMQTRRGIRFHQRSCTLCVGRHATGGWRWSKKGGKWRSSSLPVTLVLWLLIFGCCKIYVNAYYHWTTCRHERFKFCRRHDHFIFERESLQL